MCKELHAGAKKTKKNTKTKNRLHLQDEKKLYLALAGLWKVRSAQEVKSNAPASNQIVDACWAW